MNIALGTWQLSGSSWATAKEAHIERALENAIERGFHLFDTAPSYADGNAERVLGRLAAQSDATLRIMTKVPPDHLTKPLVRRSVYGSMERLGVSEIDTVFIHWPAGTMGTALVPIEETLDALFELKEERVARRIGLSNFNAIELKSILPRYEISALQYCYSLLWRSPEFEVLPTAYQHSLEFYAYSPLAMGLLFGRRPSDLDGAASDHRLHTRLFKEHRAMAISAQRRILEIAGLNQTRAAELALLWLLNGRAVPVVGLKDESTIDLLTQLSKAISLSKELVASLMEATEPLKEAVGEEYSLWG